MRRRGGWTIAVAIGIVLLLPTVGAASPETPVGTDRVGVAGPTVAEVTHDPRLRHADPGRATLAGSCPPVRGGACGDPSPDARGRVPLTGPLARFPHPTPIPAGARTPAPYMGHYYAGNVFNGTNFTSTQVSARLGVPADAPNPNDFYYVILSVWDDAGSYDQVGLANANGVWGIAYSTTSYCGGYYYYSPDAYTLTEGLTYNFSITIDAGTVNFTAVDPNGTTVWSLTQSTGGSVFVEAGFYSCAAGTFYDYTDYEEVYDTTTPVPPYDFKFTQNLANNTSVTSWGPFLAAPPAQVQVLIVGYDTTIANTPYDLTPAAGAGSFILESPKTPVNLTIPLSIGRLFPTSRVALSTYAFVSGWAIAFAPPGGRAPFNDTATVTVAANASVGNYVLGFVATNNSNDGTQSQVSESVDIVPGLSVALSITHTTLDLGGSTKITAVATGGLGGNTFNWTGTPPGCIASGSSFTCSPTQTGTFSVSAVVRDQTGARASSPTSRILVNAAPEVQLTVNPTLSDANQTVILTATANLGSGGFSYRWAGLPGGCTGSTNTESCVPPLPGSYNLSVAATDLVGGVAVSPTEVLVVAPPPVASLAADRLSADVGQNVTLTAEASGGVGNYTFSWPSLPTGCLPDGGLATCRFTTAGSVEVEVAAVDGTGTASQVSTELIRVSTPPTLSFAPGNPASTDLGQPVTFHLQVSGGPGGNRFGIQGLPAGCESANSTMLTCRPTGGVGSTTLWASVIDVNGFTVDAPAWNFTVYSLPFANLATSPTAPVVGNPVTITMVASGGAGGFVVTWADLPGGCQPSVSLALTCTPNAAGTYPIVASVTDRDGGSANATLQLLVQPAPSLVVTSSLIWVGVAVLAAVLAAIAIVVVVRRRRPEPAAPEVAPSDPESAGKDF